MLKVIRGLSKAFQAIEEEDYVEEEFHIYDLLIYDLRIEIG